MYQFNHPIVRPNVPPPVGGVDELKARGLGPGVDAFRIDTTSEAILWMSSADSAVPGFAVPESPFVESKPLIVEFVVKQFGTVVKKITAEFGTFE